MTRIYPRSALALLLAFGSASSVVVIAVPIDVNLGSSFTGAASSSCSSTMAPTHTVESTAVTSVSTASAGPSSVLDAAPTRHFPEADADNFLPGTVPKVLQVEQVELNRDSIFKHQRRAQSGEAKNPKNLLSLSDLPWPPSYELATEKLPSYKNAVKKLPAPPTLTYQVVHHPVTGCVSYRIVNGLFVYDAFIEFHTWRLYTPMVASQDQYPTPSSLPPELSELPKLPTLAKSVQVRLSAEMVFDTSRLHGSMSE
ncbi:hypothetical protein F5880DRAFT_1617035 [Lentinula raphanica]|nr:hypothetical protein F5880DRAFT_1617035 [Lentinula raphanica]